MNVLLKTYEAWLLGLGILILIAGVLFLVLYLISGFRKKDVLKSERIIVDEIFLANLIKALGLVENIVSVSVDNGRVKFLVKDLDLLIADDLKALSTSGVFITGNNVKLLFKYDAKTIIEALKERGVSIC